MKPAWEGKVVRENCNKRNIELDYVRAICMIWGVGFWHLTNYTKIASIAQHDVLINITMGVLGTFTFCRPIF